MSNVTVKWYAFHVYTPYFKYLDRYSFGEKLIQDTFSSALGGHSGLDHRYNMKTWPHRKRQDGGMH
jgi:hypothetical protein